MLVYDAPVVDRPHFLEKNMLQSNRRHWFDQVFSFDSTKTCNVGSWNAKEDGYTWNQVLWRQCQGGLGGRASLLRLKIEAAEKHGNVSVSLYFKISLCYLHLFTQSSINTYYQIIFRKLRQFEATFLLDCDFQRVNRNKWTNFVGCCIDQTFWREARVHVVSFGDQDTEARFSSFSVLPSLTWSRGVLRCWKWRLYIGCYHFLLRLLPYKKSYRRSTGYCVVCLWKSKRGKGDP